MNFLKSLNLRRSFSSISARLVGSHILIVSIMVLLNILILYTAIVLETGTASLDDYRFEVQYLLGEYLLEESTDISLELSNTTDFALIFDDHEITQYTTGNMSCEVGERVQSCAPDLIDIPIGERYLENGSQQLIQIVAASRSGHKVIVQRTPYGLDDVLRQLNVGGITGVLQDILTWVLLNGLFALPLIAVFMWLIMRPVVRRIAEVSKASQRFAEGDFRTRVHDDNQDEVGRLARQFNVMAQTLEQNVGALRDLAQQNALLAQKAERQAIQTERLRIARDLHDMLAQRLFGIAYTASALPELMRADSTEGIVQAQDISRQAERALLDMRTLLVELRPSDLIEQGLVKAIRVLCEEWQRNYQTKVDVSIILQSERLSSSIEHAVYATIMEALSNVAKHAAASSVAVTLIEGQRQLLLTISDNGRGIHHGESKPNGSGLGLVSITERATALGGKVEIESVPGNGFTLQFTMPIHQTPIHQMTGATGQVVSK